MKKKRRLITIDWPDATSPRPERRDNPRRVPRRVRFAAAGWVS